MRMKHVLLSTAASLAVALVAASLGAGTAQAMRLSWMARRAGTQPIPAG